MCLYEFAIIDDTLETLGAPKEYQRPRNWIIRIIIGFIVYVFYQLASFIVSILILNNDINLTFFVIIHTTQIAFLINYPSNVIILSALISAAIFGLVLYLYTFTL